MSVDEYQIRSYQRAWSPDRMFHGWEDFRLPRPVPIRSLLYVMPLAVLSLLLSHLVGVRVIYDVLPGWARVLLPFGLAWILTMVRVQGRFVHSELSARVRSWRMPRWVSGCYWPEDDRYEQVGIKRMLIKRGE